MSADTVYVAEGELAELMRRSNGRHLRLSFGFGGPERVWLQERADWELVELQKIRAAATDEAVRS